MAVAQDTNRRDRALAAKIPFRLRLRAWWKGYELVIQPKKPPGSAAGDGSDAAGHGVNYEPEVHWDKGRVRLVQEVWGKGFHSPGGEEYIIKLVKPFGLNPAMSLLDIGAGLGGASRVMAENFGVWVTGLEQEGVLAEAGMELSTMAGMAKKAPIHEFDPENYEGKAKSYDCVFSKEALFVLQNKERLFKIVCEVMKNQGQLLFTDYVLTRAGATSSILGQWREAEPITPNPWSVDQYSKALADQGLEIRITEDITDDVKKMVTQGWADFMTTAEGGGIEDDLARALVGEVELWTKRMQAIDAGDLKVCRIHALKKSSNMLLSDW